MARRLADLTLDNLSDLPVSCRRCVFWELAPAARDQLGAGGHVEWEKEAWVSDTLLEWGTCGRIVYVDERPAGYVLYAPPAYVPTSEAFPTSPAAPDTVLLITGRVLPGFTGGGLGRVLAQSVARDAVRRGYRAIEAFGRVRAASLDRNVDETGAGTGSCLLPVRYLSAVGFSIVRPHPVTPRLRLDLRGTVTWRAELEAAVDRLRSGVPAPVAGS